MNSASLPVRLGLLSDTHGDVSVAAAAVRLLGDAGATTLIHLGDLDTDAVLEELLAFDGRVHVVAGNCDQPSALRRHTERLGITMHEPLGELTIAQRRVVFCHGHLVDLAAPPGGADYFLHGHTHRLRDERIGVTRVISPGALSRAQRRTVAILDIGADHLEIHEVIDERIPGKAASRP